MKNLLIELNILQNQCIGLFKNKFSDELEMVINDENGFLHVVTIGRLGGLHETHIDSCMGKYKKFPDNQTLLTMKNDPFVLSDFCKSF